MHKPVQAAAEAAAGWPTVRLPGGGEDRVVSVPGIGFSSTQALTPNQLEAPARRGQDTRAILQQLGVPAATAEDLFKQGVIFAP
ncbi:hypothetical protein LP417_18060 [Polaromonas sp. P1-6]|nr:hypothetical protein LP417_18060 [Polaromonas sp. P1-6]